MHVSVLGSSLGEIGGISSQRAYVFCERVGVFCEKAHVFSVLSVKGNVFSL